MTRLAIAASISLACLLSVVACGGGGCSCDATITETMFGEPERDGWVTSMGSSDALLPGVTGDLDDFANGESWRQLLSLDHSGVPAGVTIVQATLQVHQRGVQGTPFTTHGVVTVDHLDYGVVDGFDYATPAITAAYGTLSSDASIGPRTLDVTSAVRADREAGRFRTQFRLRFSDLESDGDNIGDHVAFGDADNANPGEEPVLIVEYKP
ncbi:MAG: hypothetical protein AB7U23_11255 [Dehalococcoidia bacterium]